MGKTARKTKAREEVTVAETEASMVRNVLAQLVLPLAELVRGDLRELVHTLGMQAIASMLEQERTELCGERYKHSKERQATRGGSTAGRLTLGGRTVQMRRPRVVGHDGEVALETWEQLAATDPMSDRAYEQMVVGVATRKYARSLEPLPAELAEGERSTSKSTVSRKFVAASQARLNEWLGRDLAALDLVGVFIDGLHFQDDVVLVALGVDSSGNKHVLGLWEGATENGAACSALLSDLQHRGLRADRTRLFVIDGSKALRSAIRDAYGKRALVQRCQVHKVRNVLGHLPKERQTHARNAMRQAYKSRKPDNAKKLLLNLAASLESKHPGAAASLREGLDETLTVMGLGLSPTLERSFATTNPIENFNGNARHLARRVKRWRGGSMILRWVGAAVAEAEAGFRRLKGHRDMPALVAALRKHDEMNQSSRRELDGQKNAA
ncbi:MAG TPA: IS256 family transposase [Terrimesophilobacter sp.]|jgi:transposase-like protein|nr:IS256 family transposase [Terrimesophilobacter sp.]HRQ01217.1 IS256 family transposase [Terrimesophilobacter sp.]